MNYSPVGIANMSLLRIGARGTIGSLTEQSVNAVKINTVWQMILQEVLSERDWKFAKTRAQLQKNANSPAGGYKFAYALPADFLRLCKVREIPEERRIADANVWFGDGNWGGHRNRDIPVWPREVEPYIVESVMNPGAGGPTYTTNLLSNYPHCDDYTNARPIVINYIRLISDFTQLLPGFVNALAYRLAGEIAVSITEDTNKAQGMMQMYFTTLNSAQAQTECDDFLQDEQGSQSWVTAGRYGRGRY